MKTANVRHIAKKKRIYTSNFTAHTSDYIYYIILRTIGHKKPMSNYAHNNIYLVRNVIHNIKHENLANNNIILAYFVGIYDTWWFIGRKSKNQKVVTNRYVSSVVQRQNLNDLDKIGNIGYNYFYLDNR